MVTTGIGGFPKFAGHAADASMVPRLQGDASTFPQQAGFQDAHISLWGHVWRMNHVKRLTPACRADRLFEV